MTGICSFYQSCCAQIYTLSLHDALPISVSEQFLGGLEREGQHGAVLDDPVGAGDRKSTRLNSSHVSISYAVFCLKKKTRPRHGAGTHRLCARAEQTADRVEPLRARVLLL